MLLDTHYSAAQPVLSLLRPNFLFTKTPHFNAGVHTHNSPGIPGCTQYVVTRIIFVPGNRNSCDLLHALLSLDDNVYPTNLLHNREQSKMKKNQDLTLKYKLI